MKTTTKTTKTEVKPIVKTTAKPVAQAVMPLTGKKTLLEKYKVHKTDTGSIQVQVALLTERIANLSNHLKNGHHTDNDSRRGLLILVGKRRKLLNYLARIDIKEYEKLIKDLGLRK